MNYELIHDTIISRARGRSKNENTYYERHHILPRCEGGLDDGDTVLLTVKEHGLIHLLRYKMTKHKGNLGAYNLQRRFKENVFQRKDNARFAAKRSHVVSRERNLAGYFEMQRGKGKKGGESARNKNKGFFALSEQEKKNGRDKGRKTTVCNKLGMFSDEYRKKHAVSMQKVVICNGITYGSCTEAAEKNGVTRATISNWIRSGKAVVISEGEIREKMTCR